MPIVSGTAAGFPSVRDLNTSRISSRLAELLGTRLTFKANSPKISKVIVSYSSNLCRQPNHALFFYDFDGAGTGTSMPKEWSSHADIMSEGSPKLAG